MNKNGTVIFKGEYYFFRLIDFHLILEKVDQVIVGTAELEQQKLITSDFILGMEFRADEIGQHLLFKLDGALLQVHAGRYEAMIEYYLMLNNTSDFSFHRVEFTSPELNDFYSIQKGYSVETTSEERTENKIILQDQTEEIFDFMFEHQLIHCTLTIDQYVKLNSLTPLKLATKLVCDFPEQQDVSVCKRLTLLMQEFLQFISYRQDVSFTKITLLNKQQTTAGQLSYKDIGELLLHEVNYQTKIEQIGEQPIIQFDDMKENIGRILTMLAEKMIYLEHIPKTVEERTMHSIEKTILTAAAFEWEFAKIYPQAIEEYNEKHQQYEDEFIAILTKKIKKSTGKEKKYYKNMKYLVQHANMNLSKRIHYALQDVEPIIGDMIEKMYHINNFEDKNKIHEIAERIQSKRNIFAHGNLSVQWTEEEEILMVGDIVTLQLLYYAIVLKEAGLENQQVKRCIDTLFQLGYFTNEK